MKRCRLGGVGTFGEGNLRKTTVVFADQQQIPRLDLARLTNVAGTAVASLEAEADLRSKIERLAA